MVANVLVIHSPDRMADGAMVIAAAQYHKEISYHMSPIWEVIKTQSIISWIISLSHHHKFEQS